MNCFLLCLLFVFIWTVRFGFVINVFSLNGLTLLPEISKDKERTFKEFEGIGEDKSWKAHENDAVEEYRQSSGGYYRVTHG